MRPAQSAKRRFEQTKLLVVDNHRLIHARFADLNAFLQAGDLLVMNSSSTLPSSFRSGPVELRLAAFRGRNPNDLAHWAAVLFGPGDWHTPTEQRAPPPRLKAGDRLYLGTGLHAQIAQVHPHFPRLVEVAFSADHLVQRLYEHGRPIQYSYLNEDLQVWDQQTLLNGPPLSVEPPCAAFALNWQQYLHLQERGIRFATVLHSAGLSSSGDEALDALFPLDEYFAIPDEARRRILAAKTQGRRVIAVGTTVARALESAFGETYRPEGYTELKLGPNSRLRVVDALITGMHAEGTSHAELMKAFCDPATLAAAEHVAIEHDYLAHEFGDLIFLKR